MSMRPIRKITAAGLGGVPIAAGAAALFDYFWPGLPEPVIALIGAAIATLTGYVMPSGPGEPTPPPAAHHVQ